MATPSLVIKKQDSLGQEQMNNKTILIVSKTLAFNVVIASASSVSLKNCKLSATLYYDNDGENDSYKPVDRVKVEPLTFRSFIHTDNTHATFEIRIVALTSQHEDALFRVKFSAIDFKQNELKVFSQPIRVVSKPSLVNKRKRSFSEMSLSRTEASSSSVHPSSSSKPSSVVVASPSSSSLFDDKENISNCSGIILSTLQKLERQQNEWMTQMQSFSFYPTFETAFHLFMEAFQSLPVEERSSKLRKVMKNSGRRETFDEMISCYIREKEDSSSSNLSSPSFLSSFDSISPNTFSEPFVPASPQSPSGSDELIQSILDQLGWSSSEVD